MSTVHAGPATQTAFIVQGTASPFAVLADPDSGVYPDWQVDLGRRTRKIPGANRSVTWFDGTGLATIALAVYLPDRAAYRRLLMMTGQTGTLQLLAGFTSHEGDTFHSPADGRDYERYADTTMLEPPQRVRHLVGGEVECELVFGRAWAPVFTPAATFDPVTQPRAVIEPTLLLPLDGDLSYQDRSGTGTATGSGALRFVEGAASGTQAAMIEEGTTNYAKNPVLANDSAGWTYFVSSGSTIATNRVNTQPDMSPWVWEGHITGIGSPSHSFTVYNNTGVPALTGSITPSAEVKSSRAIPGSRYTTRLTYTDGFVDFNSPDATLPTAATRITFPTATVDPARTLSSVQVFVWVFGGDVQVGDRIWITEAQIENKAYATSYTDGSLGPGYAWTGTAHASASTRAGAAVTVPSLPLDLERGSLVLAARNLAEGGSGNRYLFQHGAYGVHDFMALTFEGGTPRMWFRTAVESGTNPISSGVSISAGGEFDLYLEWDGEGVGISVNGGPLVTGTRASPTGTKDTSLTIGAYNATQQQANAAIGPVAIFDRPLTDAERAEAVAAIDAGTLGWTSVHARP